MKKTLTINLGGILFNIDEDAYDILHIYINNLKRFFENTPDNAEIIEDIESRMAELFLGMITKEANIISITQVQTVIAQLGNPEDYADGTEMHNENYASKNVKAKFYRDKDNNYIGGVCSGIAAYFNIDPLYLRLLFAFSVIFLGTGILIYLILWALIPEASTLAQKLEMRGQPITIKDIEFNVKTEMKAVANNFSKIKIVDQLIIAFKEIFGFFGRLLFQTFNLLTLVFSILALLFVGFLICYFLDFNLFMVTSIAPLQKLQLPVNYSQLALTVFLFLAVPLIAMLVVCLKNLFKIKITLRYFYITAFILWFLGLILSLNILNIGLKEFETQSTTKSYYHFASQVDTISLSVNKINDEWVEHNTNENSDMYFRDDSIYFTNIALKFQVAESDSFKISVLKRSQGRDSKNSKMLSNDIIYDYKISNNEISLGRNYTISPRSAYRGQQVDIIIDVPKNKAVKLDKSLEYMIESAPIATDTMYYNDMPGKTWLMTNDGLVQKK